MLRQFCSAICFAYVGTEYNQGERSTCAQTVLFSDAFFFMLARNSRCLNFCAIFFFLSVCLGRPWNRRKIGGWFCEHPWVTHTPVPPRPIYIFLRNRSVSLSLPCYLLMFWNEKIPMRHQSGLQFWTRPVLLQCNMSNFSDLRILRIFPAFIRVAFFGGSQVLHSAVQYRPASKKLSFRVRLKALLYSVTRNMNLFYVICRN